MPIRIFLYFADTVHYHINIHGSLKTIMLSLQMSRTQKAFCLKSSIEKRHYLARLLMCGGTRLLREKFDSIHKRENLELTFNDPAIRKKLEEILLDQEWDLLYLRNSWKFTSSAKFDFGLTLELLKTIHSLTPRVTGWRAVSHGFSFENDLTRIERYCSSVARHQEMTDARFNYLWKAISDAFLRIAGGISPEKRSEWEILIDEFLQDPLTSPEGDEYDQLQRWSARRLAVVLQKAGNALATSFPFDEEYYKHILSKYK